MIGAGPLIVIETEVVGAHRSKPEYAVADLAVDVGPHGRIFTVERHRVEGRRKARGGLAARDEVEAPVGALRRAFAREHARRILALAAVREHARRVGVGTGQVFLEQKFQQFAPARVARGADLRNLQPTEAFAVIGAADLLAAHGVAVFLGADPLATRRPLSQQLQRLGVEFVERGLVALTDGAQAAVHSGIGERIGREPPERCRQRRVLEFAQRLVKMLRTIGKLRLVEGRRIDRPALLRNLGEVAHPVAGNQRNGLGFPHAGIDIRRPFPGREIEGRDKLPAQVAEHPVYAGVVELAGDRREDRNVLVRDRKLIVVAPPLLADVAQRILGAALVELVQHDQIGIVDHVDLLELARRAVLARHHVNGKIDQIDNLAVALPDPRRFDDHHVEAERLQEQDHVAQHFAGRQVLATGCHRAHVDTLVAQAVHANPVAEQRTTRATTRGVHRQHGDALVREKAQETTEQLVRHAALARAAGPGDAHHRDLARAQGPFLAQTREVVLAEDALLDRRDHLRYGDLVVDAHRHRVGRGLACLRGAFDQILDHPDQTHLHAVARMVDPLDAVGLQVVDLIGRDGAAAAAEDADVFGPVLAKHVDHVAEELDVSTLVGADRDAVGILLQRRAHDVPDAAVVAEVYDLRALRLYQAAHHVDRGIVAVEE